MYVVNMGQLYTCPKEPYPHVISPKTKLPESGLFLLEYMKWSYLTLFNRWNVLLLVFGCTMNKYRWIILLLDFENNEHFGLSLVGGSVLLNQLNYLNLMSAQLEREAKFANMSVMSKFANMSAQLDECTAGSTLPTCTCTIIVLFTRFWTIFVYVMCARWERIYTSSVPN